MRLVDLNRQMKQEVVRLSALIDPGKRGGPFELYFDFRLADQRAIDDSADAFAAALLVPATRAGEALDVSQPISPRLHLALPRIRDIFCTWWPKRYARIEVRTSPRQSPTPSPQSRHGSFFSGGVDSFYNLAKLQRGTRGIPLTDLIFMRGVETPLERSYNVETTEAWIQDLAASVGVNAVFGETNIRTCFPLSWETYYYGSALAAIALCLSPMLGYVSIASTLPYNHLVPAGSHPLVDESYSTEGMQIIHEGAEATRPRKLAAIMEWNKNIGLNHLRVCLTNAGGPFNCGRCRKCVRTAITLYALGLWDHANTFLDKSTDHWEDMAAREPWFQHNEENLEFVRECGADRWLIHMLERVVQRRKIEDARRNLEMAERKLRAATPNQECHEASKKQSTGTVKVKSVLSKIGSLISVVDKLKPRHPKRKSVAARVVAEELSRPWLTPKEISDITGGAWVTAPLPGWYARGISYGTVFKRESLVIPKGPSFLYGLNLSKIDASDLSSCAVMAEDSFTEQLPLPRLIVPSVRQSLAAVAARARKHYTGTICAVTGSVGKSSTCSILHHAISQQGICSKLHTEYNTHDGIVAQIANLSGDQYAVLELTVSSLPDVEAILQPWLVIVTANAFAQLRNGGSEPAMSAECVAEALTGLEPGGAAVINRNAPCYAHLSQVARERAQLFSYGDHPDAHGRLLNYRAEKQLVHASIHGEEIVYRLAMHGRHNAINSLGVLVGLHALSLDWRKAASQFCVVQPSRGQGEALRSGGHYQRVVDKKRILLINEPYKASPPSMAAALNTLAHMTPHPGGRRIAVLSDIPHAKSDDTGYHNAGLAEPIIDSGIDRVYIAGESMKDLWHELPEAMRGSRVDRAEKLLPILRAEILDGDVILFKGNNLSAVVRRFDALSPSVKSVVFFAGHRTKKVIPVETSASSSRVTRFALETRTGAILLDDGGSIPRGPASLVKMALLYRAFEALEAGHVRLDEIVSVPARARRVRGSALGLRDIEKIHIRDLIASIAICSANDSAVALAINLAGSVTEMIRQINELGQRLGLRHTTFRTVSGLHRTGQLTTARDMATLGYRLMIDHPDQRHWFSCRTFNFNGRVYRASNTLLGKYPGVTGIKTGTTPTDGAHLVASVSRGSRSVIAVTMGTTKKQRDAEMTALLDEILT